MSNGRHVRIDCQKPGGKDQAGNLRTKYLDRTGRSVSGPRTQSACRRNVRMKNVRVVDQSTRTLDVNTSATTGRSTYRIAVELMVSIL